MVSISQKNLKRDQQIDDPRVNVIFARKAEAVLRDVRGHGLPLVVVQVWRSKAQGILNKLRGKSQTGAKSLHCRGLAMDAAFQDNNGKIYWPPADHPWWQVYGSACKAHGLTWGGDWRMKDMNHCELR